MGDQQETSLEQKPEVQPVTRMFQVWSEGWAATGGSGAAAFHGEVRAENFKAACDQLLGNSFNYDSENSSYWGCRLFDNEQEARKSFG